MIVSPLAVTRPLSVNSVPAKVTVCPYVLLVLSAVIVSAAALNRQSTVRRS